MIPSLRPSKWYVSVVVVAVAVVELVDIDSRCLWESTGVASEEMQLDNQLCWRCRRNQDKRCLRLDWDKDNAT